MIQSDTGRKGDVRVMPFLEERISLGGKQNPELKLLRVHPIRLLVFWCIVHFGVLDS